ncbi:MAG: aminotransferase class IV [Myxococcota bacterium]
MLEVFTTIMVLKDGPLFWKAHLGRLWQHAVLADIKYQSFEFPIGECLKLIKLSHKPFLLRISLNQDGYTLGTRACEEAQTKPVKVFISDQIVISNIKTNQRAVYDEALRQAQQHHAFEGLLLNQSGYVVDGSKSSLILRRKKTLISLAGGLCGITRQMILQKAKLEGFEIAEDYLRPKDLKGELYLAGTGVGLVRCVCI